MTDDKRARITSVDAQRKLILLLNGVTKFLQLRHVINVFISLALALSHENCSIGGLTLPSTCRNRAIEGSKIRPRRRHHLINPPHQG